MSKGSRQEFHRVLAEVFLLAVSGCTGSDDSTVRCGEFPPVGEIVPVPNLTADASAGDAGQADAGFANAQAVPALPEVDCEEVCPSHSSSGSGELLNCRVLSSTEIDCEYRGDYGCWDERDGTPGRRPAGLFVPGEAIVCLGDLFAYMAFMEAASVHAFRRLSSELRLLGAPKDLIIRAHRAARDERRHAKLMTTLTHAHGGRLRPVHVQRMTSRDLLAVALENEAEGVVRETFSALIAKSQATFSHSRVVRRIMTQIAEDEAAHAKLAWDVRAWAIPQLSPTGRDLIAAVQEQTFHTLNIELQTQLPADWHDQTGLPRPTDAQRLLKALQANTLALSHAA